MNGNLRLTVVGKDVTGEGSYGAKYPYDGCGWRMRDVTIKEFVESDYKSALCGNCMYNVIKIGSKFKLQKMVLGIGDRESEFDTMAELIDALPDAVKAQMANKAQRPEWSFESFEKVGQISGQEGRFM